MYANTLKRRRWWRRWKKNTRTLNIVRTYYIFTGFRLCHIFLCVYFCRSLFFVVLFSLLFFSFCTFLYFLDFLFLFEQQTMKIDFRPFSCCVWLDSLSRTRIKQKTKNFFIFFAKQCARDFSAQISNMVHFFSKNYRSLSNVTLFREPRWIIAKIKKKIEISVDVSFSMSIFVFCYISIFSRFWFHLHQ